MRLLASTRYDKGCEAYIPSTVSRPEHDMSANSPWNIQINLDVIRRRLLQAFSVLVPKRLDGTWRVRRVTCHQQVPSGSPPTVGDPFVYPLAQFGLFGRSYPPTLRVASFAFYGFLRHEHARPFVYPRRFFGRHGGRWYGIERFCVSRC